MKTSFILFCISIVLICLAWMAKLQFIFGGDYIFRTGTILASSALLLQTVWSFRNESVRSDALRGMFLLHGICLLVVYLGMMLKVSHLMNTQLEKDIVLDFFGLPAMVTAMIYTFSNISKIMNSSTEGKRLLYRHVLFPWMFFLFSFMIYAVYSVVLTRV